MIVATPLDLAPLQPDSWSVLWAIWNKYSGDLVKTSTNLTDSDASIGNRSIWRGLDIYRASLARTAWTAPYYDISRELPQLLRDIKNNEMFDILHRVRIIQSNMDIPAHSDDRRASWYLRCMLHNTDVNSQWYFTANDSDERKYLHMPKDTNWFAYNDAACKHGSDYRPEHTKLLVQFYGEYKHEPQVIARSINKYKEYTITL